MRRLIKIIGDVRIYRDSEYNEYIVGIKGQPAADYFTNDKDDALATAKVIAASLCGTHA
jgi:hypothetical protein